MIGADARAPRDGNGVNLSFDPFDRHNPLVMNYLVPPEWAERLGFQHPACAQIAASALDKARHVQPWISYSRNRNHYSQRGSRYDERPDLYRYSVIPPAVDALADAGFLENITAPNNPHCGWQSAFKATPALIEALGNAPPPLAKLKLRALIRLRDASKHLIDFRDTERTTRMARGVAEINEALNSLMIELPQGIGERCGDLLLIGDGCANLGNTSVYRVFNETWKYGGRFYGHFVQNLPKNIRRQLIIDGEPVAEPDYPAHHLRILYALEGLRLFDDPYDLHGWERDTVKRAVLILINASTRRSAIGAIAHRSGISCSTAARVIGDIKRKHAPIKSFFHSGAGRWLQRLDGDMAERVELGLMRLGIVALPVHDSFIVPARYEDIAREQMSEAFHAVIFERAGRVPNTASITATYV